MRLRTDSCWDAFAKRAVLLGTRPDPRGVRRITFPDRRPGRAGPPRITRWAPEYVAMVRDDGFEPARDGDVWRIRGHAELRGRADDGSLFTSMINSWGEDHPTWPVIGYGLTCPNRACLEGGHRWTHAHDCRGLYGEPCKAGPGRLSCWEWTGSPEDGNLSASPSLFIDWDGCGWHGFLTSGAMTSV